MTFDVCAMAKGRSYLYNLLARAVQGSGLGLTCMMPQASQTVKGQRCPCVIFYTHEHQVRATAGTPQRKI